MFRSALYFLLVGRLLAASATGYHVSKQIPIGGEGGWDYLTVDSPGRRLYVSHATKVVVVDLDNNTIVGEIPDTQGVHGIAVAPDLGRGFTSNGRANNVTIFDLKTLKTIGQVATGQNPDAIQYERLSHRIFTFNGKSNDSTVINGRTGAVEGTIPLDGKPEFSATDGRGKIFVNIEDKNELAIIDAASMKVQQSFSLQPCESPSGLAIDAKATVLFSVCRGKTMAISNGIKASLLSTAPIGEGPDGVAFDPGTGYAFSSNGEGNVTIVAKQGDRWEALETVTTTRGARTIAVDPKTHKLYLPAADLDTSEPLAPGARPRWKADSFKLLVLSK